jgi:hypothetical protein
MARTPYKMKGHSLPGPNQKKSPAKFVFTTAAIIAAAKAAAISGAVSAAVGKGVGAISKAKASKKADKLDAQNKAKEASAKSTEGMGDIGSKTKLTD